MASLPPALVQEPAAVVLAPAEVPLVDVLVTEDATPADPLSCAKQRSRATLHAHGADLQPRPCPGRSTNHARHHRRGHSHTDSQVAPD